MISLFSTITTFIFFFHLFKTNTLILSANTTYPDYNFWFNEAKDFFDEMIEIRRELHKIPEMMLEEYKTSAYIKSKLDKYNIRYVDGWAKNPITGVRGTGIIADIGTGNPPCVMLRSDFDGLPIEERADVDHSSIHDGLMHSCGHDGHVTWVLGAGLILNKHKQFLNGTVRLLFQPGEEGAAGAKLMVEEGALTHYPPVDRAFGFHVNPEAPSREVLSAPSTVYCAATDFSIKIYGKGGAGYNPHMTSHALPAAVAIIHHIHDIHTFFNTYDNPSLISTSIFRANSPPHVAPYEVDVWGSIRSFKEETLYYMASKLERAATSIAEIYGCTISFRVPSREIMVTYPITTNDPEIYTFYKEIVEPHVLNGKIEELKEDMGSEDFSFFAQKVPSVFGNIGVGGGEGFNGLPATNESCHSPYYVFDDSVLQFGAALNTHIAFQNLINLHNTKYSKYPNQ